MTKRAPRPETPQQKPSVRPAKRRRSGPEKIGVVTPPPRMSAPKTRTVIVEQVYHQRPYEQATSYRLDFVRLTDAADQPYVREISVGPAWTALDLGWIAKPGVLHLLNTEGKGLRVRPTEEEQAAIDARVVEVRYAGAAEDEAFLVEPGNVLRCRPAKAAGLVARCKAGPAKCQLTVLPL